MCYNEPQNLACEVSTAQRPSIVADLQSLINDGHKFKTVLADPPWRYENTASRGAAANHYPTMAVQEICAEPIGRLVDDSAHLHLWTTNAFLEAAFDTIDEKYGSTQAYLRHALGADDVLLARVRANLLE